MNEAEFLKTRYGLAITEPDVLSNLQSKRIVLHIKCDKTCENDAPLDLTWTSEVRLIAIVVDSYSLLNTDGPVSITLTHANESNKLSTSCNFKGVQYHDVMFPGKQDFSTRVWFKMDTEKLDSVKQYGFSKEDFNTGLIRNEDDYGKFVFLTHELKHPNDPESPPYCPLGFVIHRLKLDGDTAFASCVETQYNNNKGRALMGYMLTLQEGEDLLKRMEKITGDNRPLVNMSTLSVNCNGHGSKFSLCVALDVYYNPVAKTNPT